MTARRFRRAAYSCLVLASGALVSGTWTGCGGSSDVASPPPVSSAPPPQLTSPRPAGGNAPVKPVASSEKPTASTAAPKVDRGPLPPGGVLVGGSEPNAVVLPRNERPELLALVSNPGPGIDSSQLTIVPPPRDPSTVATVALPPGFTPIVESRIDASGLPTRIRCEKDGMTMALVPGGLAIQGDDGAPTTAPRHPIDVDSYYIDLHEVTVEKYLAFREASKGERSLPSTPTNASFPLQPAVGVTWRDAMLYARWSGKELPTESEWEKAARGTKGFLYPWGNDRPLWEAPRQPGQIDDVRSFRTDESVYGVMDLAGNAREWCQDFFAEDAYRQAPTAGSAAARNWAGPKSDKGSRRVVKGSIEGWWLFARSGVPMTERLPDVGFRCVLRVPANGGPNTGAARAASPSQAPAADQPAAPARSAF